MAGDPQDKVVDFLETPEAYDLRSARIERIDTHISHVFLAGERAYKIKRSIRFPYADFSTLDRRAEFCHREVELNRRTAPDLYLGLAAVVRRADGPLHLSSLVEPEAMAGLEDAQEVVEWVVVMRRFDQEGLFDRLAQAGRLDDELLRRLAGEIARFHAGAEPTPRYGGRAGIAAVIDENADEWGQWPNIFEPARVDALNENSRRLLSALADLLDRRRDDGRVRRCHGDLHLRNVVLFDDRPQAFDAIEFNDDLACIDTLYDVAFLLMDLDHRGLRAGANAALNRLMEVEEDYEGLSALPLFLSLRAAVRAKISATIRESAEPDGREDLAEEARNYFALAERYLSPPEPLLIAVGGLSGTGKSTQARRLAPWVGASPGAVVLRTDVIRKQLFEVPETEALPKEAYRPQVSARVYDRLRTLAGRVLASGHAVIADAVFARPEERSELAAVASEAGVPFKGLWLEAPAEVLSERVSAREADASDADAAVVRQQLTYDLGEIGWHRVDASDTPERIAAEIARVLGIGEGSGVTGA